jgi:hypothetical protein
MTCPRARFVVATLVVSLAAAFASGCGETFIAARPTEPVTVSAHRLAAEVARLWLTDDVRDRGLADDVDLVVELDVTNGDAVAHRIAPGSFYCALELDARQPGETRALPPGGGGEGDFPGGEPDEGSLLAPVTIPPGQTRRVWALFHGYRFDDSERPRRVTLRAPFDAGALTLVLADPARGALRWQTPAASGGLAIGLKNISLLGGGLRATGPSTEVEEIGRHGRVLWDAGLLSTVLVETRGPLVSSTSAFSASGLIGHLSLPVLSWGAAQDPRQLGVYAGGSASFALEIASSAFASQMKPPHAYGLFLAEAGLELDMGALHFAPSPFPLTPANQALPRWSLRLGYTQAWADGVTGGGYTLGLRFVF